MALLGPTWTRLRQREDSRFFSLVLQQIGLSGLIRFIKRHTSHFFVLAVVGSMTWIMQRMSVTAVSHAFHAGAFRKISSYLLARGCGKCVYYSVTGHRR
ncbi:hypothetical protein FA15DRAFT_373488 [Coprinopsis marcescibilis]|uniref:Uncharacterized protein n=1 Tax=Coprinopsis marcescibilis TaxID=230819 RepID=A0A5C3KXL4_COPMA|nr:hypothetical protein FA15DRAFT_373488 [Coprinopsis marcescibilis]